jgi:hypothetical protein
LSVVSTGVAKKIDEYTAMPIPTNSTRPRSRSVPAPRRPAPMKSRPPTGSSATRPVLIDRISVWLTARLAASAYVCVLLAVMPRVFSCTLSNTTTTSYSAKPRMVRKPMIVDGVISKPTSEYTPAVSNRSNRSEETAATAIRHSNRTIRYSITTAMKMTRPSRARSVTWAPHAPLTRLLLISPAGMPNASTRCCFTASDCSGSISEVRIR